MAEQWVEEFNNAQRAKDDRIATLQRDNEALRRELDQTRQLLDICTAKLPNDVDSDSDIDQMAADLAAARELATESAKAAGSYRMDLAAAKAKLEECERDAQRYRWLRDKCDTTRGFLLGMRRERDEWDTEIDAALAQDNEP